jgi:hypothetical protein
MMACWRLLVVVVILDFNIIFDEIAKQVIAAGE